MAQMTTALCAEMLTHCDRKLHPPLTVNETAQLLHAWIERETLRAAFRDLNSANDKLLDENFALAAGQCANVTGDEGGTPQCAEIARLKGEVMRLHSELARLRHD